jgi:hypothetical protein
VEIEPGNPFKGKAAGMNPLLYISDIYQSPVNVSSGSRSACRFRAGCGRSTARVLADLAQQPSFFPRPAFRGSKRFSVIFFGRHNNNPVLTGKQRRHVVRFQRSLMLDKRSKYAQRIRIFEQGKQYRVTRANILEIVK